MDLRLRAPKASLRQPCRLGAAFAQVSRQGAWMDADGCSRFRARPVFLAYKAAGSSRSRGQGRPAHGLAQHAIALREGGHQVEGLASTRRRGVDDLRHGREEWQLALLKIAMNPCSSIQGYWSRFSLAADVTRFVEARGSGAREMERGAFPRKGSGMRNGDVSIQMDKTWE